MSKTYMAETDYTNEFQPVAGFSEIKTNQQLVAGNTGKGAQVSDIFASILFGFKVTGIAAKRAFFWPLNSEIMKTQVGFAEFMSYLILLIAGHFFVPLTWLELGISETISSFVGLIVLMGFFLWVPVQAYMKGTAALLDVCKEKLSDIAEEVRTQK